MRVQARNQGGPGGSSEPPFSRTPSKNHDPPDLNISNSTSDIVFQIGSLIASASTPIQHKEPPLGASVFRTPPPSTLFDPLTRSNRLNLLKNRKHIIAGKSSEYRRDFAHHDVPGDVNKTASRLFYQSISKNTFNDC